MDILEEIDVFLSACQLTQDESNNLVFNGITGCFESKYLADWFVNQINFGWKLWQADKARAVPEWINVNDKLPPANILVLGMSQTPRNIFNIYNVMALDEFEEADVTHWMPLPDAPQEPANADTNS